MTDIKNILEMLDFTGDCPYRDFAELEKDRESLLNDKQKFQLKCIKNIAIEIKNNEK